MRQPDVGLQQYQHQQQQQQQEFMQDQEQQQQQQQSIDHIIGNDPSFNNQSSQIISNQNDCRFIPNSLGQTATRSLMSFHWVDSVCI